MSRGSVPTEPSINRDYRSRLGTTLRNACSALPSDRLRVAVVLGRTSPLRVHREIVKQTALKAAESRITLARSRGSVRFPKGGSRIRVGSTAGSMLSSGTLASRTTIAPLQP
ncbi:hypothetical protein R1flu_020721 [Riccia fluitans]|uniref:Uncharacterized protein n=1 Tax=Riccia fluitans TaxID=41844 RepID=A0ABD1ZMH9_9MARC